MNPNQLSLFTLSGFTLNPEEQSVLLSSLKVKKTEEKLVDITLVAKIIGVRADYYVAMGQKEDVFERKYYYW